MRRLGLLAAYLLLVFGGGGLIAPWIWWAGQHLASAGDGAWWSELGRHPFHRYVHRCLLVMAIVGLIPLARGLGCRHWRDLGLGSRKTGWREGLAGAGIGGILFGVLVILELTLGWREWRGGMTIEDLLATARRAALAGAAVGLIEEILFRGLLCGGLQRFTGWPAAAIVSSLVFAAVHFFDRPASPEAVAWTSGWMAVSEMLGGLAKVEKMVPAFLTLFAAGILLSGTFRWSGRLYVAMGLHGAWVFCIKMSGSLTRVPEHAPRAVILGQASQWLTLALVILAFGVMALMERRRRTGAGAPDRPEERESLTVSREK